MKYVNLGKSDLKVSRLCLGTMTFGEQTPEQAGHDQIDYASSIGINFMDTAEMYSVPGRKETQGSTERIIGSWFKKNPGKRKEWVLATKATGPSPLFTYIAEDMRFTPSRLRQAIDGSLKRLNTDYIDLYQLHWPERKTNCFGVLGYAEHDDIWQDNFSSITETMQSFIIQGKIRAWGLSNETPWGVMRSFACADHLNAHRPVSIQNPYNLLNRSFEIGLSEICMRESLGMMAYSPLAFGLLTGKYHTGKDTPTDRINQFSRLARYNGAITRKTTAEYLNLAIENGITLTQLALSFAYSRPFISSVILGASNMEQLIENSKSALEPISKELLDGIEKIHAQHPNPAP